MKNPDDVARAILPPYEDPQRDGEDQLSGSVWKWLKANGRYLAPAKGSGDVLLAGAILIRNWLSVHVVLATFGLAVFVLLHLVRESVDVWFPSVAFGFGCSDRPATPLPLFAELDKLLNCNLPFGGNYLWWSPWLFVPSFFIVSALLVAVFVLFFTTKIFSKGAYRLSRLLKRILLVFGVLLAMAVIDTLGQTIYLFWVDLGTSVNAWFLALFAGVGGAAVGAAVGVRGLAARLSDEVVNAWMRPSLRLAAIITAVPLLVATLTAINAASHGIAWQLKYPSYVYTEFWESPVQLSTRSQRTAQRDEVCVERADKTPGLCSASGALTIHACTKCVQLGRRGIPNLLLWFAALAALSMLFGRSRRFLNHSSLWPLYTARLIRAYLGASNPRRIGSSSGRGGMVTEVLGDDGTEGDTDDDTPLNWLAQAREGLGKGAPLHFVNVTINETVSSGAGLQHNDQRGIGMAVSPAGISAGIRHHVVLDDKGKLKEVFPEKLKEVFPEKHEPYRMFHYSRHYCGERLTLGQWIGISGAALSTGMGSHTSLAASLLFGFFNVRLGYWWNSGVEPRARTAATCARSRLGRLITRIFVSLFPVQSYLLDEFTARFHGPARRWWYLSDGGHFENMGGYELIRRRLPLIVVVDAEADPDYRFEGLGNLVRKARTDFGAIVKFLDVEESNRGLGSLKMLHGVCGTEGQGIEKGDTDSTAVENKNRPRRSCARAALARVQYRDGATPDSLLVYLKPTILGDEPVDIFNYHVANPDFPHETTADQFFDDAQWESYRKLGWLTADRVFDDAGFDPYHRLRDQLSSNPFRRISL